MELGSPLLRRMNVVNDVDGFLNRDRLLLILQCLFGALLQEIWVVVGFSGDCLL